MSYLNTPLCSIKKGDKSDENNDVEHLQAHAANAEEGLFLLEFDT